MGNFLFCFSFCILFLSGHADFTWFKKPVYIGRYIRPKPESEFMLSLSKGELWYLSSLQEACFHMTIKVPPLEVESLEIDAHIGVTKYGKRNKLRQNHCRWTDVTKLSNISSEEIQFVGCTWYMQKTIISTDTLILSGTVDIKIKHRNSQHWSRERHDIHQRREQFVGVIDMELNNFCLNKTYKNYCQNACRISCIDWITGQDRLFCDTQWGTSCDALYLGTGSPKYDPLYLPELDPHLVKVINGSLIISESVTDTPCTTPSDDSNLDANGHDPHLVKVINGSLVISKTVTDSPYTTQSDDSNLDADDHEILFHAHQKGGAEKGETNPIVMLLSIIPSLAFTLLLV